MKIFWDNNIVIDLLSNERPKHLIVQKLLSATLSKPNKIVITPVTIATTHYVLSNFYKYRDAVDRIARFRKISGIVEMNEQQFDYALADQWPDFEDALQYQSALASRCDYIITRDSKGFKKSKITVLTPEQFLEEHHDAT